MFTVGFGQRKKYREVKPHDLQINGFTSKEILVEIPLKSALIYIWMMVISPFFGLIAIIPTSRDVDTRTLEI